MTIRLPDAGVAVLAQKKHSSPQLIQPTSISGLNHSRVGESKNGGEQARGVQTCQVGCVGSYRWLIAAGLAYTAWLIWLLYVGLVNSGAGNQ